jgi:hypothetical protein
MIITPPVQAADSCASHAALATMRVQPAPFREVEPARRGCDGCVHNRSGATLRLEVQVTLGDRAGREIRLGAAEGSLRVH